MPTDTVSQLPTDLEARIQAHMPSVGDSFRLRYADINGRRNHNNKVIHVRAIVDDEYIVYRYWWGGEWVYKMTDPTFFYVNINGSVMTKIKGKS